MKIAVISSGNIPSQWAHSLNTMKHAEGFFKLGYNVEILTVERLLEKKLKLQKNVLDFYDINHNIKIVYFKDNPLFYFNLIATLNNFFKNLKILIPKIQNFYDPEEHMSNYCKKHNFDLAYCRSYRATYHNLIKKIPSILETHTPFVKTPNLKRVLNISKNKYFKGLITISDILKKKFINEGVPKEKILVLEDAVDLKKFEAIKGDINKWTNR